MKNRDVAIQVTAAIIRLAALAGIARFILGLVSLWMFADEASKLPIDRRSEIGEVQIESLGLNVELTSWEDYTNVSLKPTWPGTVVNVVLTTLCIIVALRPLPLARFLTPKPEEVQQVMDVNRPTSLQSHSKLTAMRR
jgi:hypothetical protein